MNQNSDQTPQKDNTLKIVLIVVGSIAGVAIVGIVGFLLLISTIFNKSVEIYEETKEEIEEKFEENNNEENNYSEPIGPSVAGEYANIHKIDYKTFNEMIANKETFVIVISQTSCSHCIAYKPIFDETLREHNIKGYELDLQVANKTDLEDFLETYPVEGTPTTMIFTKGVYEEEMRVSVQQKDAITNFLKKYNLVK